MKLREWAAKQGISYITAWRWFQAGDARLANAYQSDSGTIIVPDENDASEQHMTSTTQNEAMSLFLKKTVEFSKNNSTVEDFAAYIISNFQIKLNDTPKFVKQKMKAEEVQKHFKQFLPDKEKEEHLKAVKIFIKAQAPSLTEEEKQSLIDPNMTQLMNDIEYDGSEELESLSAALSSVNPQSSTVHMYGNAIAEGLVNRSVDLNTTPQQINYTGSANPTFSSFNSVSSSVLPPTSVTTNYVSSIYTDPTPTVLFSPTQKELESTTRISSSDSFTLDEDDQAPTFSSPRRRGRPTKKK